MTLKFRPRLRFSHRHAHVCPVCSTVTSRQVSECRVCGWHGKFDITDPQVAAAMDSLVEQCPNLQDLLPLQWPGESFWSRLWARVRRRRKIDIRA